MKRGLPTWRSVSWAIRLLILLPLASQCLRGSADAPPSALNAFNAYVSKVEQRLAEQHRSSQNFLASPGSGAATESRLRHGELIIEQLTPAKEADPPGGLLHHWRGTAFVRGATAADFEHLMKNFNAYPKVFSPQITKAWNIPPDSDPDHFQAFMRIRQHHIITVVMDTTYDISCSRLDAQHGYSISRSTKISEIKSPGTPSEHALSASEEHGFLWRLNTYWSYEEREDGLYMQVEAISLTRSIPTGLAWAIRPYIVSVPRESLEFTLRSAANALRK